MKQAAKTDRSHYPVRKTTLAEQDLDTELENTTAEERLGMMWQLAQDAWAFMGKSVAQSRLPRHTLRVRKYKRMIGRAKDRADASRLEKRQKSPESKKIEEP